MNGTNPVTASITNIIPGNGNATIGYKTFNLTVTINELEGTLTNENTILIVCLPWDKAGNPVVTIILNILIMQIFGI